MTQILTDEQDHQAGTDSGYSSPAPFDRFARGTDEMAKSELRPYDQLPPRKNEHTIPCFDLLCKQTICTKARSEFVREYEHDTGQGNTCLYMNCPKTICINERFAVMRGFKKARGQYILGTLPTNVHTEDQDEIRDAKRVAAISEAMNIIRTLNSHGFTFEVRFKPSHILFLLAGYAPAKVVSMIGIIRNGYIGGALGSVITLEW